MELQRGRHDFATKPTAVAARSLGFILWTKSSIEYHHETYFAKIPRVAKEKYIKKS